MASSRFPPTGDAPYVSNPFQATTTLFGHEDPMFLALYTNASRLFHELTLIQTHAIEWEAKARQSAWCFSHLASTLNEITLSSKDPESIPAAQAYENASLRMARMQNDGLVPWFGEVSSAEPSVVEELSAALARDLFGPIDLKLAEMKDVAAEATKLDKSKPTMTQSEIATASSALFDALNDLQSARPKLVARLSEDVKRAQLAYFSKSSDYLRQAVAVSGSENAVATGKQSSTHTTTIKGPPIHFRLRMDDPAAYASATSSLFPAPPTAPASTRVTPVLPGKDRASSAVTEEAAAPKKVVSPGSAKTSAGLEDVELHSI